MHPLFSFLSESFLHVYKAALKAYMKRPVNSGTASSGNTLGLIFGNLAVAHWASGNTQEALEALANCLRYGIDTRLMILTWLCPRYFIAVIYRLMMFSILLSTPLTHSFIGDCIIRFLQKRPRQQALFFYASRPQEALTVDDLSVFVDIFQLRAIK